MKLVLRASLACAVLLLLVLLALAKPLPDFIEYWTSAHLLTSGGNPYSLDAMFQMQKSLGWRGSIPLMNLTPPWALPFIAPLGFCQSYPAAWLGWVLVMAGLLAWSARVILDVYSQGCQLFPQESRRSDALIAFTFYPALLAIVYAQITTVSLGGLALFLHFESRKKHTLAGAALVLASIKPQLLALVWLALLLDVIYSKCWRLAVGFLSGLALLSAAVTLMRPSIWAEYLSLTRSGYMVIWASAIGVFLRIPFGLSDRSFILQFLPLAAGIVWLVGYYRKHASWVWADRLPAVVTVSILTTAYGWLFDQVLLVIPIVYLCCRFSTTSVFKKLVWLYTFVNTATILASIFSVLGGFLAAPILLCYAFRKMNVGEHGATSNTLSECVE